MQTPQQFKDLMRVIAVVCHDLEAHAKILADETQDGLDLVNKGERYEVSVTQEMVTALMTSHGERVAELIANIKTSANMLP